MRYPRKIYAIYPFDENGNIAGVYVGSSFDYEERIKGHFFSRKVEQEYFHSLMRTNGFTFQLLGDIQDVRENHLEYDWMDFLNKSGVKVFNSLVGKTRSWEDSLVGFLKPVWTGSGVTWKLTTDFYSLQSIVKESGLDKNFIAKKLELSYQDYLKKESGKVEFTSEEISILKDLLALSNKEVSEIFLS